MAAHTGERAEKTGTFHCRDCDEPVRVKKGQKIPECPCGGTTFESRTQEPGSRRQRRKTGKSARSSTRRTSRGRVGKKKAA